MEGKKKEKRKREKLSIHTFIRYNIKTLNTNKKKHQNSETKQHNEQSNKTAVKIMTYTTIH